VEPLEPLEPRHRAGPDRWWAERYGFECVLTTRVLRVEYTLLPRQGRCWFVAMVGELNDRVVLCRDLEVPLPAVRSVLEIRSGALWSHAVCEQPFEHWTVAMEAYAVALDKPQDAWIEERGERLGLAFDLEWEAATGVQPPSPRVDDAGVSYAISAAVYGDLQVGDERVEVHGAPGQWEHRWGVLSPAWDFTEEPVFPVGHGAVDPDTVVMCWTVDGPQGLRQLSRRTSFARSSGEG
jgi:hypothetical protein